MSVTPKFKFDFKKYNELLKRGLCGGPVNKKGQVCIEVACSIALGESADPKLYRMDDDGYMVDKDGKECDEAIGNDEPSCVHPTVRTIKIALNDAPGWKSPQSRAKGLRILGIAQLGTSTGFNIRKFRDVFDDFVAHKFFPLWLEWKKERKEVAEFYRSGRFRNPSPMEATALEWTENWRFHGSEEFFEETDYLKEKDLKLAASLMVEALRQAKSPGIKLLKRL